MRAYGDWESNRSKDILQSNTSIDILQRSSEEEHKADALALGADEGRDKLRKAVGRSKYPMNHRYPNEGTHLW